MKVKTSVTLSPEVLAGIDKLAAGVSRSEFIEKVLKRQILLAQREERDRKDTAIYARLSADPSYRHETEEVLELQVPWFELGSDECGELAEG
ncbi:MAG: ribbon-helix-helix protein, CopG family [Tepidiformaceae bacterium]